MSDGVYGCRCTPNLEVSSHTHMFAYICEIAIHHCSKTTYHSFSIIGLYFCIQCNAMSDTGFIEESLDPSVGELTALI